MTTPADVLKLLKEKEVKFVDLRWCIASNTAP